MWFIDIISKFPNWGCSCSPSKWPFGGCCQLHTNWEDPPSINLNFPLTGVSIPTKRVLQHNMFIVLKHDTKAHSNRTFLFSIGDTLFNLHPIVHCHLSLSQGKCVCFFFPLFLVKLSGSFKAKEITLLGQDSHLKWEFTITRELTTTTNTIQTLYIVSFTRKSMDFQFNYARLAEGTKASVFFSHGSRGSFGFNGSCSKLKSPRYCEITLGINLP